MRPGRTGVKFMRENTAVYVDLRKIKGTPSRRSGSCESR